MRIRFISHGNCTCKADRLRKTRILMAIQRSQDLKPSIFSFILQSLPLLHRLHKTAISFHYKNRHFFHTNIFKQLLSTKIDFWSPVEMRSTFKCLASTYHLWTIVVMALLSCWALVELVGPGCVVGPLLSCWALVSLVPVR